MYIQKINNLKQYYIIFKFACNQLVIKYSQII